MAHIPDGFLSPAVLAGTAVASGAALAFAARRTRAALAERQLPLLGAVTAFVFAAQLFNFPLAAGTSAHLLGGVLVAVLAGPWVAMLVVFSVLLVQALLFQDGGIAALGANTLNLAVLGAGGGWVAFRYLLLLLGGSPRSRLAAAALAGWASAVLTGVAVALELALSGAVSTGPGLAVVGGAHLLVGVAEGAITAGVLSLLWRARPDLAAGLPAAGVAARRWAWGVTGAAVAVAALAGHFASARPDVLEAAAEQFGLHERVLLAAPFPGYEGLVGGPWGVALLGVLAGFALAWLLLRSFARR